MLSKVKSGVGECFFLRKKEQGGMKSKEGKREKDGNTRKQNAKVQQEKHNGCRATKLGVPQGE